MSWEVDRVRGAVRSRGLVGGGGQGSGLGMSWGSWHGLQAPRPTCWGSSRVQGWSLQMEGRR